MIENTYARGRARKLEAYKRREANTRVHQDEQDDEKAAEESCSAAKGGAAATVAGATGQRPPAATYGWPSRRAGLVTGDGERIPADGGGRPYDGTADAAADRHADAAIRTRHAPNVPLWDAPRANRIPGFRLPPGEEATVQILPPSQPPSIREHHVPAATGQTSVPQGPDSPRRGRVLIPWRPTMMQFGATREQADERLAREMQPAPNRSTEMSLELGEVNVSTLAAAFGVPQTMLSTEATAAARTAETTDRTDMPQWFADLSDSSNVIVFGGEVASTRDGQIHRITAVDVARLLGIPTSDRRVRLSNSLQEAAFSARVIMGSNNGIRVFLHGPSPGGHYDGTERVDLWSFFGRDAMVGLTAPQYYDAVRTSRNNRLIATAGSTHSGFQFDPEAARRAMAEAVAQEARDSGMAVAQRIPEEGSKAWERIKAKGCIGRKEGSTMSCTDYAWGCHECPARPAPPPHSDHRLGRLVRMKLISKK